MIFFNYIPKIKILKHLIVDKLYKKSSLKINNLKPNSDEKNNDCDCNYALCVYIRK